MTLTGSLAQYRVLSYIRQVHCDQVRWVLERSPGAVVVIDTETTGLDVTDDEVLQVAAVDGYGRTLIDVMVRPTRHNEWPGAMAVNRITPDMVRGARPFRDVLPLVQSVIDSAIYVVGYNVGFDLSMLVREGIDVSAVTACDVMDDYAAVRGVRKEDGTFRRVSLGVCCDAYGIVNPHRHTAIGDATATLGCLRRVADDLSDMMLRGDVPW